MDELNATIEQILSYLTPIYNKIVEMGGSAPLEKNINNLAASIRTIPQKAPWDPSAPTLEGLKYAIDNGLDIPIGLEIPDTYNGNPNPLITAQYITPEDDYGGKEGMILIRKYVEPISQNFSSGSSVNYPNSTIANFLANEYMANCSLETQNLISDIEVPYYDGMSVTAVTQKWFLMSAYEVCGAAGANEGAIWDYWRQKTGWSSPNNSTNDGRVMKDRDGTAQNVWLRSRYSSSNVHYVYFSGGIYDDSPTSRLGVLPACFIEKKGTSPVPDFTQVLTQEDFKKLQKLVEKGTASNYIPLGQTLKIARNETDTIEFEVTGFNDVVTQVNGTDKTVHAINLLAKDIFDLDSYAETATTNYSDSHLRAVLTGNYQNALDPDFVACLANSKVSTCNRGSSTAAITYDKMYAPSLAELGVTDTGYTNATQTNIEGPAFPYYVDATNAKRARGAVYWTRTYYPGNTVLWDAIDNVGNRTTKTPTSNAGVVGACNFIAAPSLSGLKAAMDSATLMEDYPIGTEIDDVWKQDAGNTYNIKWRVTDYTPVVLENGDTVLGAVLSMTKALPTKTRYSVPLPASTNTFIQEYGDNEYTHSIPYKYLNSDAASAGGWWSASSDIDVAPTTSQSALMKLPGFMWGISDDLKKAISKVEVLAFDADESVNVERATNYFFLPSVTELGGYPSYANLSFGYDGAAREYYWPTQFSPSSGTDVFNEDNPLRVVQPLDSDTSVLLSTRTIYKIPSLPDKRYVFMVNKAGSITTAYPGEYTYMLPSCVIAGTTPVACGSLKANSTDYSLTAHGWEAIKQLGIMGRGALIETAHVETAPNVFNDIRSNQVTKFICGNAPLPRSFLEEFTAITTIDFSKIANTLTKIPDHFLDANIEFNGSLNFPNVTEVGNDFCRDCQALNTKVSLPSVVKIGDRFMNLCNIYGAGFTIPTTCRKIGNQFMAHCDSITSMNVPSGVEQIGYGFLGHSYKLTSVTVNCAPPEADITTDDSDSANYTLSTSATTNPAYKNGITVNGSTRQAWIDKFPNKSTSTVLPSGQACYRKLILGSA